MKSQKVKFSLSSRISFWIVLVAALLLAIMVGQIWLGWGRSITTEVEKDSMQVLDNTVMRVNGILEDAELAAANLYWLVERDIDKPDEMVRYSNEAVRNNPVLNSCSIAFEPYFYPEKGRYYSIFSYHDAQDSVAWEQEGDEDYDYFSLVWYQLPKQLERPCWTEPYCDMSVEGYEGLDTLMVSYCWPFFTKDTTFAGTVAVDISLKWLTRTLHSVKPYPNSYCVMLGSTGSYLVHPNYEKLFYDNVFTDVHSDPDVYDLGHAMLSRERGMRKLELDGEPCFVFFAPLETTGWSLAIVCPEKDIYGNFQHSRHMMTLNILVSLLAMFFLFGWLIRRQIAPLSELAARADYIASGNLDHPLEPTHRNDEIGLLTASFQNMQTSLVRYIQELTTATAMRERMERELQIARNIQMGMVPHQFPTREDVDLYASMTPAREVGGDLYDFLILNDKLYICVGDVSGKGVPASLIMAVSRGMFRILAHQELEPVEIAARINDTLSEENKEMLFVTMFIACIDLHTGVMDYCNCGHNAPVLIPCDGNAPVFLDCKPNTVIGVMPGFAYEGQRVDDVRGQVLFLYTDGLNEAENAAHEQYGNDAMLAELGRKPFQNACSLIEQLNEAVGRHVDGAEPSDDLTLFCVKINA